MTHIQAAVTQSAWPGCFLLPAFDEQVPMMLGADQKRSGLLARFAKISAEEGVPLPKGSAFESIEKVLTLQWQNFVDGVIGRGPRLVVCSPIIVVRDDCLGFRLDALSNLNVFQLKPVIKRLEEAKQGLGWFVTSVLERARSHGHEFYDMCIGMYVLDCYYAEIDEFTDKDYVRHLVEIGELNIPMDKITPEVIAELKPDYTFWPSDVLESVDGYGHLLGRCKAPTTLSARAAKKWLRENSSHALASVVLLAIELQKAFDSDVHRAFAWHAHLSDEDDELQPIGAAGFIAWDDPTLLLELVQHHEEYAYNGGGGVEEFARCFLRSEQLKDDANLRKLVVDAKSYFKRWALINELLLHFPTWND